MAWMFWQGLLTTAGTAFAVAIASIQVEAIFVKPAGVLDPPESPNSLASSSLPVGACGQQ